METTVIMEIKQCPSCGGRETLARKACALAGVPTGPENFASLGKQIVPLEVPKMLGGPVKVILTHLDICVACGLQYATLSVVTSLPSQATPQPQGPTRLPPFMGRG